MSILRESDLTFPLEITAIYIERGIDSNKVDVENIYDLSSVLNVCDYHFIIHDPIHGDLEIRWSREAGHFLQPIKKISKSEFMS